MATTTISIAKSGLKTSIIEALYNEILTNSNNYYYFLGKTLPFGNSDTVESPLNTVAYEYQTRDEIIFLKKITASDVSYIIPKYNWFENTVFDIYDDRVGNTFNISAAVWSNDGNVTAVAEKHGLVVGDTIKVTGSSPTGYNGTYSIISTSNVVDSGDYIVGEDYKIYIAGTTDWNAIGATYNAEVEGTISGTILTVTTVNDGILEVGQQLSGAGVTPGTIIDSLGTGEGGTGTYNLTLSSSVPTTTTISAITVGSVFTATGVGSGTGKATANYENKFTYKVPTNPGSYVSGGLVTYCSPSGADSLESSKFYCLTSDYHVYKCLNNNGGAPSTIKPFSITHKLIELDDGYIWKYMYTIPIASRNKFMTLTDIPVTTAIKNAYYSRGSISSVQVPVYGSGYSYGNTELVVYGNGHLDGNAQKIIATNVDTTGTGYVNTPALTFSDPFITVPFEPETSYTLGTYIKSEYNIYEVISPGTSGLYIPTHTSFDPIYNGTLSLKWVGRTATGNANLTASTLTRVATFDAEDTDIVVTADDILAIPSHGFETGFPVVYSNGGGDDIGGLVDGDTYYVNKLSTNEIYLYDTYDNAIAEEPTGLIDLDTGATGNAHTLTVSFKTLDTIQLSGILGYINILNPGYGYTSVPRVDISSASGRLGEGTALLTGTRVTGVAITNRGLDYTSATLVISDPIDEADTTVWGDGNTVALHDIIYWTDSNGYRYYEVTNLDAGTSLGSTAPTHTAGTAINGDVGLTYVAEKASGTVEIYYGYGYNSIPTVTVENSPVDGQLIDIAISDGGANYSQGATALISNPTFGTTAEVSLTIVDGEITDTTITNPGLGYETTPTITIVKPSDVTTIANGTTGDSDITLYEADIDGTITGAEVTGYIQGLILTVTDSASGVLAKGQVIYGNNVLQGTSIVNQLTSTMASTATTTASSGGTAGDDSFDVASATNIAIGQIVSGTGVQAGTYVTNISSTTITLSKTFTANAAGTYNFREVGKKGTYTVNLTQTAASGIIAGVPTTLVAETINSGTLAIGQTITGTGITAGTRIVALSSGTGGLGTYTVDTQNQVESIGILSQVSELYEGMTVTGPGIPSNTLITDIVDNVITLSNPLTENLLDTDVTFSDVGENFTSVLTIGLTATGTVVTEATKAKLSPIIEDGQIVGVITQDGGVGYTTASIEVVGDGTGAELIPNVSIGDLNTNQANVELLAVPGSINNIKLTNFGFGYTATPSVTITGDGTGATASAYVTDGQVKKIIINTPGEGYTRATVTIGIPNLEFVEGGVQASARAIISPIEGHGSNAVQELFASDISFFSTISTEKNQGFTVDNDYRQLGIIKNPSQFGSSKRFTAALGTGCFAVVASGRDGSDIDPDDLITDVGGNEFRVVAVETVSAGLNPSCNLLLQSLDNAPITTTQELFYTKSEVEHTLTVTNFTAPSVNKYSGNLLFIDNRNSFVPSLEQSVSVKTAIRF